MWQNELSNDNSSTLFRNVHLPFIDGNEYLYVVDEILTILPEELEDMIGPDVSDERQITLVTCTPTGVGSHRLLIIGHMVEENN